MGEAVITSGLPVPEISLGAGDVARPSASGAAVSAPAEVTDAQLALSVQRGEVAAYDLLVRRHMQRAFAVAMRLLGQQQDAEDLVQEAFIAALEKIDTFDTNRDFAPWFYRILVNRGLNARKSRARRSGVDIPVEAATSLPSPLVETERSELRVQLKSAMALLPERQQLIVSMFDLEGFSSPEIAEVMGISDGTVRWHLHQARRVLREALQPYARRNA